MLIHEAVDRMRRLLATADDIAMPGASHRTAKAAKTLLGNGKAPARTNSLDDKQRHAKAVERTPEPREHSVLTQAPQQQQVVQGTPKQQLPEDATERSPRRTPRQKRLMDELSDQEDRVNYKALRAAEEPHEEPPKEPPDEPREETREETPDRGSTQEPPAAARSREASPEGVQMDRVRPSARTSRALADSRAPHHGPFTCRCF